MAQPTLPDRGPPPGRERLLRSNRARTIGVLRVADGKDAGATAAAARSETGRYAAAGAVVSDRVLLPAATGGSVWGALEAGGDFLFACDVILIERLCGPRTVRSVAAASRTGDDLTDATVKPTTRQTRQEKVNASASVGTASAPDAWADAIATSRRRRLDVTSIPSATTRSRSEVTRRNAHDGPADREPPGARCTFGERNTWRP